MTSPDYGDKIPIAALATSLGESALALIRTSGTSGGKSAIDLLAKIFSRPQALLAAPGNTIVYGWIVEPASEDVSSGDVTPNGFMKKLDEVLVSVYRAPHSYTGEDGADICCHGGIAAVKAVMAALKKAGFREALKGEFTFRAFMNGKLDLTKAESVMELVAAKTSRSREQAVRRLSGVLEREISAIKEMLVEVLAAAEIYLDYSEDEFLSPDEESEVPNKALAEKAVEKLKSLSELWSRERIYAEGALAVLAGMPNAGKSSLFNYLIREDRSIVTDIPGTTRDWIEAVISLDEIPLRLADTAGLRKMDAQDPKEIDEAERIGVKRSMELLEKADLVLYVVDGVKGFTEEDRDFLAKHNETQKEKPLVILWNKADIAKPDKLLVKPSAFPGEKIEEKTQFLPVSAKTGEGIPELLRLMAGLLEQSLQPSLSSYASDDQLLQAAGPGSLRQKELIDSALSETEEALALAGRGESLDLIAPLIRSAVNALGEITGEVSNADILKVMFSRFCVGK
jgi:tRNA modification GTPase